MAQFSTEKNALINNNDTLCMRRVDNATKLDVWFAFTIKEID